MPVIETVENFARAMLELQQSDRDVNLLCGGFTGEGKTTMLYQINKAHSKISGLDWDFRRNMTYSREELLEWIDGKKNTKKGSNGLRENQLPMYSAILIDELFSIFYKRNWYDDDQKLSIAVFNMCRDRRLLVTGAIPSFWDLDGGLINRARYYAYVYERGRAWVFEQENNPFTTDVWNKSINKKRFREKKGQPYSLPNFVCELRFPDFLPKERELYYKIRNKKRLVAGDQVKGEKKEQYSRVKNQRDTLIKIAFELDKKLTNKAMGEYLGLSKEVIRLIRIGLR